MEILKWVLTGYVVYSIVKSAFTETSFQFTKEVVSKFSITMVAKVLITLVLVIITAIILNQLPALDWGWTQLLYGKAVNIIFAPLQNGSIGIDSVFDFNKVITIAFLTILLVVIPKFTYSEEKMFRSNAVTTKKIIVRSLGFGLIHCIVGVSIGTGLALSIGGLLFASVYRKNYIHELAQYDISTTDGNEYIIKDENSLLQFSSSEEIINRIDEANKNALIHSTSYHTMYNWILVTIALISAILS